MTNFPKISLLTCSDWLGQGGKKNAGEKSYKFFREGYAYDIYTCEGSGVFYVKARCYRSLQKSEDPHYLVLMLKDDARGPALRKGLLMHHLMDQVSFLKGKETPLHFLIY